MGEQYIVPCPTADDWAQLDQVPLALARERKVTGRLFRKHILNKGELIHPVTGAKISIDDAFVGSVRRNFTNGVCDIVQVPVADAANKHTETPLANIGEVVGLEELGDKVYALIDARDDDAAGKLGRTLLGASAFLSTDYTDTHTGERAGPTLLHVAVTNRPYVTGLEDYEEVLAASAASADNQGQNTDTVVLTPPPAVEEAMPELTREELVAALRDQHGVDVEALAAQAERGGEVSQLTTALTQALANGGLQLANGGTETGVSGEDIVGAISELAQLSRSQAEQIGLLQRERAAAEVDSYIAAGRLLPKARERAVELALTNPDGLADFVAPADKPYVVLSQQQGIAPPEEEGHVKDIDAEVVRLTGASHTSRFFTANGTTAKN